MRLVLALSLSTIAVSDAAAGVISMICQNPRREYVLTYNTDDRSLVLGDTSYKVLAVERTEDRFIVAGTTVNGGPTFQLHIRPYRKIDFYSDGSLDQTDGCR